MLVCALDAWHLQHLGLTDPKRHDKNHLTMRIRYLGMSMRGSCKYHGVEYPRYIDFALNRSKDTMETRGILFATSKFRLDHDRVFGLGQTMIAPHIHFRS